MALELDDSDEMIRGFTDVLAVRNRLWILPVESKRTSISVPAALPQLLAYMLASSQMDRPVFGMATNGDEFVFLKLTCEDTEPPKYDGSRTFSLFLRKHELVEVLRILKRPGQMVRSFSVSIINPSFYNCYTNPGRLEEGQWQDLKSSIARWY